MKKGFCLFIIATVVFMFPVTTFAKKAKHPLKTDFTKFKKDGSSCYNALLKLGDKSEEMYKLVERYNSAQESAKKKFGNKKASRASVERTLTVHQQDAREIRELLTDVVKLGKAANNKCKRLISDYNRGIQIIELDQIQD